MTAIEYVLVLTGLGLLAYGLYWLQARTNRRVSIPFGESQFPHGDVKAALERIGCTITLESETEVRGAIPLDGANWGQDVTVKLQGGMLLVASAFSGNQAVRGYINQRNVDRFVEEWNQRANFRNPSPEQRALAEANAQRNAKRSVQIGMGLSACGGLLLALVLLVPSNGSSSLSSRFRLLGYAIPLLGMGLVSIVAGKKRLQKK